MRPSSVWLVPVSSAPASKLPLPVLCCTRYFSASESAVHDTTSSVVSPSTGSTFRPANCFSVVPCTMAESPLEVVPPMSTLVVTRTW